MEFAVAAASFNILNLVMTACSFPTQYPPVEGYSHKRCLDRRATAKSISGPNCASPVARLCVNTACVPVSSARTCVVRPIVREAHSVSQWLGGCSRESTLQFWRICSDKVQTSRLLAQPLLRTWVQLLRRSCSRL